MPDVGLTILLAGTRDAVAVAKVALGSAFSYRIAYNVHEAISNLGPDIDLIVCNVAFDDSQMFDLVRAARSSKTTPLIPIICFRQRPSTMALHHALELAIEDFERTSFVDLHALRQNGGDAAALLALREAVLKAVVARPRASGTTPTQSSNS